MICIAVARFSGDGQEYSPGMNHCYKPNDILSFAQDFIERREDHSGELEEVRVESIARQMPIFQFSENPGQPPFIVGGCTWR